MGLGHATRDLAVMRALRKRAPNVEVVWLTAPPNTTLLQEASEMLHPASSQMISQSEVAEKFAQTGFRIDTGGSWEQGLGAQQRNAGVLAKVLMQSKPDLVYAGESFEVLFLLMAYPELKQWPVVWLTDSVTGSA